MYPQVTLFSETIPTYFVFLSLLSCGLIFYVRSRAIFLDQNIRLALNLGALIMLSGFIGARLFHVFYEYPRYYINNPLAIFYYWQGGFVFFGGVFTALIACAIYLKKQNESFLRWLDFYMPVIAVGYGLGRISCFLAGCCFGKFSKFFAGPHPVQLYVTAWELTVYTLLIFLERKTSIKKNYGKLAGLYAILHGLGRIGMELFRDDDRGSFIGGFSVSTWLAVFVICSGIYLLRQSSPGTQKPSSIQ